jgi:hypothetical protein
MALNVFREAVCPEEYFSYLGSFLSGFLNDRVSKNKTFDWQ